MEFIIIFIILAFIAALNGDSSGIKVIAQIVIYMVLILGTLYLAVQPGVMPIIGIIVAAVFLVIIINSLINKKKPVDNTNINFNRKEQELNTESNVAVISEPIEQREYTGFKADLQKNTKTPDQILNEKWLKEQKEIIEQVNNDYSMIKQELIEKAKTGKYVVNNNQRCIYLNFYDLYLSECINRNYSRNPTGRIGSSSYRSNEKVVYTISKVKQYNFYLDMIKDYAIDDEIRIKPLIVARNDVKKIEYPISLPFIYTNSFDINWIKVKVYLNCTIEY